MSRGRTLATHGPPDTHRPPDSNDEHRGLPGIPYRPSSRKPSGKRSLSDIYTSLGAESFRVVQLHCFSDHGVLQCSFEHIPLPTSQSSTNFTAISYTWSSADRFWYGRHDNSPKLIVINNENVQVSDKVANILNLMLRTGRMTIWVDALSINQSDDAEKTVQVAQMHLIYGCASEVCVVLGSPNERVDCFLDRVNAETTNPAKTGMPQDMLRSYDELTVKERARWRQKNEYGGYLRLARNRYWRRAWIVQELVLGREVTIFCGSRSIKFAKLCDRVVRLRQVQERRMDFRKLSGFVATSEGIVSKGSMAWIAAVKCRLYSNSVDCLPRMLILELLRDTKGWNQCMDARDILYSKLALATDARALIPRTDYRMPVDALYRNFARAHIQLHGKLDIIGFAALARNRLHLPSWVPNWTAPSREWVSQRHSKIPSLVYPERCYPPIISENGLELIVKGRIMDRVRTSRFGNLQRLNDNNAFAQSGHGVPLQIYFHPSELPDTGDLICILKSFRTFVYLRPEGDGYRLVGRHELCQNWIQGGKFDFCRLLPNFRVHDPFSYYRTKDLDDPVVLSYALSCPEVEFTIR